MKKTNEILDQFGTYLYEAIGNACSFQKNSVWLLLFVNQKIKKLLYEILFHQKRGVGDNSKVDI